MTEDQLLYELGYMECYIRAALDSQGTEMGYRETLELVAGVLGPLIKSLYKDDDGNPFLPPDDEVIAPPSKRVGHLRVIRGGKNTDVPVDLDIPF